MSMWARKYRNGGKRKNVKKKLAQNKGPYTVIRAENRSDDRPVTDGAVSDALAE
jgi:hypothetical protein